MKDTVRKEVISNPMEDKVSMEWTLTGHYDSTQWES